MSLVQSQSSSCNAGRGTILVADDDPISIELVSNVLRGAGWHVKSVHNGRDVLRIVGTSPIDALILDMRMPELDGYEVCLGLLRSGKTLPTLVITGCLGDNEPLGYLNVSRTLNKPVQPQDLLDFAESVAAGVPGQADPPPRQHALHIEAGCK